MTKSSQRQLNNFNSAIEMSSNQIGNKYIELVNTREILWRVTLIFNYINITMSVFRGCNYWFSFVTIIDTQNPNRWCT